MDTKSTSKFHTAYYAEFVDPFLRDNTAFAIRAEHYMRYIFAKEFFKKIKPTVIYDVACGDGYGTKILCSVAPNVIGIDASHSLLEKAEQDNLNSKRHYVQVDLDNCNLAKFVEENNLPKPNAFVCFETLEHLEHPENLIESTSQLVDTGNYLILSTPQAHMEPQVDGKSKDPYHKQLFNKTRLVEMLTKNGFQVIAFYGQPYTNILFHHKQFMTLINNIGSFSLWSFKLLSRFLAYPTTKNIDASYSIIIVAKKS